MSDFTRLGLRIARLRAPWQVRLANMRINWGRGWRIKKRNRQLKRLRHFEAALERDFAVAFAVAKAAAVRARAAKNLSQPPVAGVEPEPSVSGAVREDNMGSGG